VIVLKTYRYRNKITCNKESRIQKKTSYSLNGKFYINKIRRVIKAFIN